MARCGIPILVGLAWLLTACAPAFNWRTQAIGTTGLNALFPCKPETVTRTLPMAGSDRAVAMRSCEAAGVTFAVAHARLDGPEQVPAVLNAWRASALAGLHADPASAASANPPPGVPALPQLLVLQATGSVPGKQSSTLIGVWFGQGADAFAAFVLAPAIPPDVVEPFFAGLRLP